MKIVGDGMVCMVVDMPGTGESAWKLEPPDGNEVYSRAIKYLASRWTGDPSRLGMMGIGFGGYWSLASASTCPEIKAAVDCGAPVHRAFAQENVKQWPGYMKVALSKALGYDLKDFEKAYGLLGEFSLLKREDLRRIACPILSINGSDDPYVPIEDLFMIAEEGGVIQEEWVYREDTHCAPRRYVEWMPRAVNWLANQIGGRERIPRPDLAHL
jgi:esterase FrsA